MKRLVHMWMCVALASCQPAPSIAAGLDDKGVPVFQPSPTQAALCVAAGGCMLVTEAQVKEARSAAYQAGYEQAVKAMLRAKAHLCPRESV